MAKKCMICGEEAKFCIKGTRDFYCKECAEESFNDISMLQKVEEQAVLLKKAVEERLSPQEEDGVSQDN